MTTKKDNTETAPAEKATAKPAAKSAPAKKPPYAVAKGKAVTSKKGILDAGDEVKAEYFAGGDETLKSLVDSGLIVKN